VVKHKKNPITPRRLKSIQDICLPNEATFLVQCRSRSLPLLSCIASHKEFCAIMAQRLLHIRAQQRTIGAFHAYLWWRFGRRHRMRGSCCRSLPSQYRIIPCSIKVSVIVSRTYEIISWWTLSPCSSRLVRIFSLLHESRPGQTPSGNWFFPIRWLSSRVMITQRASTVQVTL